MTSVVENGFLDHLGHGLDCFDVPGLSDRIFHTNDSNGYWWQQTFFDGFNTFMRNCLIKTLKTAKMSFSSNKPRNPWSEKSNQIIQGRRNHPKHPIAFPISNSIPHSPPFLEGGSFFDQFQKKRQKILFFNTI